MTPPSVIFAGGGTGGHILPAIAIAEALRALGPVRTVHIGGDRPIDTHLQAAALKAGDIDANHAIHARPFSFRPAGLVRLLHAWGPSVRTVRDIIKLERGRGGRVVMVATGGFVAAPAAQAARAERCPLALVNLDAVPGLANRWIARRARVRYAVSAAPPRPARLDWTVVQPIVRRGFHELPAPAEARAALGLDPDRPTLLVTGGSQGARTINAFLADFVDAEAYRFHRHHWQVLHQTGSDENDALAIHYRGHKVPAVVTRVIDRMDLAWAAADAAVARAGAGTVAEARAAAVPTLFLPYPYHADEHQRLNAAPLCEAGGGVLGTDHADDDATMSENKDALARLLADDGWRRSMHESLRDMGPPDGADTIAASLLRELVPAAGRGA